jgi:hypothetical protein
MLALRAGHVRLALPLLAAAALAAGACGPFGHVGAIQGSGHARSESRSVSNLDRVAVAGLGTLVVTQGSAEALRIRADDNLLPHLRSDVVNGELRLGARPGLGQLVARTPVEYHLTVRRLGALHLEGDTIARTSHLETDRLDLHVEGSGVLDVSGLTADAVTVHLEGSGTTSAAGTAATQDVHLQGSGHYRAAGLASHRATVHVEGSAAGEVAVSDRLDAQVEGSGTVTYRGSPSVTQQVEGSGSVTRAG